MTLRMCAVQIMLTTVIVLLFLLLLAVWNISRSVSGLQTTYARLLTALNQMAQPPLCE